MKTIRTFAWLCFLLTTLAPVSLLSRQKNVDGSANYVVIGAFSIHQNAIRFTSHVLDDLNMPAQFQLNTDRKLYYVYVMSTPDRSQAIKLALKLRKESEFSGTWVYSGYFGQSPGVDINPVTQKTITTIAAPDEKQETPLTVQPVQEQAPVVDKPAETKTTQATADTGDGKPFLFRLYRGTDNKLVQGDVDAIDTEKVRKLATYKGNEPVKVVSPSGKSTAMSLICNVFGYRKLQREIDYANPEGEDIEKDEEGNTIIPFELVRLRKGDIVIMFNVFFYKDAAVMRPESRYEVTGLQQMLEENPKMRIRIHGHTNGGGTGKIIQKEKDSDNYFSLTGTKEGFGSAKALSEERATLIKDYLVSVGIDPKRLEVKAWGGKKPIHDKFSNRANENVRVEIEILEE
jgi:outer membrane protein OmpA-like peptidoglycan-associated protein